MPLPRAESLQQEIQQLEQALSDPGLVRNVAKMKELSHEHNVKKELLDAITQLEKVQKERLELASLLSSDTPDIRAMAQEDEERLSTLETELRTTIEELLLPKDPRDQRDIILEIRAGAGGEEASLFAAELFRAYARYGETHGWQVHTVSTSLSEQGGYKEIVAEITGQNVFGSMKFERGVHRVQRVPATEKMGRTHTSTITVAVMPQAEEVDIDIKKEDLRIDTYRSGGAGGQHVNKTSSAVRITHLPTNTVVAVQDERSQHKNKDKAMKILRSRLLEAQEEATRKQLESERRTQVGTGDRSEKIRTYNFPQDRITDHRIKKSWSNIPAVMNGELDPIFNDLKAAQRELALRDRSA
jgi:peptide chain release factor 1